MRDVCYVRVSTEDQSQSGLSLAYQRDKCAALVALYDWDCEGIIEDAGHSAKTLNRPGLHEVLSLVRARKIDAVVVYKLDRLTRNQRDLLDLLETFKRFNVRLVSVSEQLDTESATGRFFLGMLGLIAEWERGVISERTSAALSQLKGNGKRYSGIAPYGWQYREGQMVPIEGEQQTLSLIQDLSARGLSVRKIARELESLGRQPRSGQRWHPKVIASLREGR